jgi:tetratricopeptide (TPR) repeat protein
LLNINRTFTTLLFVLTSYFIPVNVLAETPTQASPLEHLQSSWAQATYALTGDQRIEAMTELADYARAATQQQPQSAELLIWQGIVLSSLAGEKGGLGALGLIKEARASLEAALAQDPDALQGSAHTSLGTLYHQVPGWPIAFGSDKKARAHLSKALAINPDGIDSNYFMGQFMFDEGEIEQARQHLQQALQAPARPGRDLADSGRKTEIKALLAKLPTP